MKLPIIFLTCIPSLALSNQGQPHAQGALQQGIQPQIIYVMQPAAAQLQQSQTVTAQDLEAADNKETAFILSTFVNMFGNFISILQDPRNPNVVGNQLSALVNGAIAIGMQAYNKSRLEGQEIVLTPELVKELTARIVALLESVAHYESIA